jgi:glycosyltransferase involved in cell wall biosynthesis
MRWSEDSDAIRVLLVADAQSPTTWGWVDTVRSAGVVILGADGRPWPDDRPAGPVRRAPVRQRLRSFAKATPRRLSVAQRSLRRVRPLLAWLRGRRLRRVVNQVRPDLIHGLRVPREAMTAVAACPRGVPLAVSIWGNDLTLHASNSRLTGYAARRVLARADLLFADCQRDVDLARQWGLRPGIATAVLPGGGGIDLADVAEDRALTAALRNLDGSGHRLVVNARGCRQYVRNDVLLAALDLLAADLDPRVRVVFVDAAHDGALRRSVERHQLASRIIVTGKLARAEVLALFRRAEVSVSITDHDGTPNSLLEAMAAGCVPVCGDLPSIREWIEPGFNGFLAPFDDPHAVAGALRRALGLSGAERCVIRKENGRVIACRAERAATGTRAAQMYRQLTDAPVKVEEAS